MAEAQAKIKSKSELGTNKPGRNALRDQIFAAKPRSLTIKFFGAKVELRQPTTLKVLELRRLDTDHPGRAAAEMIVNYVYVPGTDELVFETADIDNILNMPFGEDMTRMNQAITDLTDIKVEIAEKK